MREALREAGRWLLALAACALTMMAVAAVGFWGPALWTPAAEYRSFDSPDGRFRVVVKPRLSLLGPQAMPGQGGNGPGVVQLVDRRGRVLQEARVDRIEAVDDVRWEPQAVTIKRLAHWPLPPREPR